MGAEFRSVQTRMWREDEWFQDLDTDARLLFIYLFTNPSASISGIYRLPLRTMAFESGLPVQRVQQLLNQFAEQDKAYYADGVVWVVKMRENQLPGKISTQVETRLNKDIASIPDCELKRRYLIAYGYPIDTVSIPFTTDTDTDTVTDTDTEHTCTPDGDAPVPVSGDKPKRNRSAAQQEMDLWIGALSYALGFDPKIPGTYQKWAKLAKGYADAGYTHTDVENWRDYMWPNDWRCQKGQPPSKAALDSGLPELKRKREMLSKPKQVGYITDPRTGESIEVTL